MKERKDKEMLTPARKRQLRDEQASAKKLKLYGIGNGKSAATLRGAGSREDESDFDGEEDDDSDQDSDGSNSDDDDDDDDDDDSDGSGDYETGDSDGIEEEEEEEDEEDGGAAGGAAGVKTLKTGGGLTTPHKVVVFDGSASRGGPDMALLKRDRKLFMSPRAADVFRDRTPASEGVTPGGKRRKRDREDEEDDEMDRASLAAFTQLSKEVEFLGAQQMGDKERRKWEAQRLTQMGAKDIASGMVRVKGTGGAKQKSKQLQRRKSGESRGLDASEGKFRNGTLYVTPLPKKAKATMKRRTRKGGENDDPSHVGGGRRPKGAGGGGKKKGKKGKGKKRR
eukprot:jgi/Mesen1/2279/ME000154S01449